MVIFKRKTVPKEAFPNNIIVEANPKGWVNEEVMLQWINKVWALRPKKFINPPSCLIYDSCSAHLTDAVKIAFGKKSILAVIPSGMTSKLQLLDISDNRSFKLNLRKHWEEWMPPINMSIQLLEKQKEHLIN
ncbi:hypothetical protein ENBRE01_2059 [Enteropsectra breve]|nr:hypothetical protein ENBRE01_2059 [Enteropsectra breve]